MMMLGLELGVAEAEEADASKLADAELEVKVEEVGDGRRPERSPLGGILTSPR